MVRDETRFKITLLLNRAFKYINTLRYNVKCSHRVYMYIGFHSRVEKYQICPHRSSVCYAVSVKLLLCICWSLPVLFNLLGLLQWLIQLSFKVQRKQNIGCSKMMSRGRNDLENRDIFGRHDWEREKLNFQVIFSHIFQRLK